MIVEQDSQTMARALFTELHRDLWRARPYTIVYFMCMCESCTDLRPWSLSHGPTSRRNWLVSYIPLGGTSKIITLHEPKESTSTSADMTDQLFSAVGTSLRKQPAFRDAATGFLGKWRLRNERKNPILMTGHYPDLGSASDCWKFASSNQKHYPDLGSAA